MWEQSVFLEHRVKFPLVWRLVADLLAVKDHLSLIRIQKSPEYPKERRLPAAAWP